MILTFKFDLDNVKMNQHAKYLARSEAFSSQFNDRIHGKRHILERLHCLDQHRGRKSLAPAVVKRLT